MSVLELVRNGGQMVEGVETLLIKVDGIVKENEMLKTVVEKQGAIIVAIKDEIGVLSRKIDKMHDEVTASKVTTDEIKHTKFIGQSTKILPNAFERVEKLTGNEVRRLIGRAAKRHSKGPRDGYKYVYEKLYDATGFDVYTIGKIRLKKTDGVDGWRKDESYINTILKEGYAKEVAVVCKQILADK